MRRYLVLCWLGFLASLAFAAPASAQSIMERLITPGPLSSDHARLESRCDSCHTSFRKEAQNSKCLDCHKGIRADIARQDRFHGKYAPARTSTCKTCHSEHKGRGYALVRFNQSRFNHNLTAWPLTGAHAGTSCTSCHGCAGDFRGTTRSCANCHKTDEPHRGRLGRNCQNCHTSQDWKSIKPYNHARTGFALTGAHARTQCMSCHKGQQWQDLSQNCASCHAADDAHRGSRGTNCASCHRTSAWKEVTFDHDSTGFSLVGGHAQATCTGCHGAGNANKHPSRSCYACHVGDDTHKGANGTECGSCHNPASWSRVSFDHDRMTEFPLKGAHRRAACGSCHKQPAKEVKPPVTCFGCHAEDDAHDGGHGENCGRCHTEGSWEKVSFNHDTMTDFPLSGSHARAECESCHTRPPDEMRLSTGCGACHAEDDVHKGQLGENCSRCHNTESWDGVVRFDHALTRFPLLGKHGDLQCKDCHSGQAYRAKGVACADCHVDDHHKGGLGQPAECSSCHNTLDWKNWAFDHDSQTEFALEGRHRGLICSACHGRAGDPAETGSACIDCHKREDVHRGGLGQDCARCHVPSGFDEIIMPDR